MKFTFFRLLAFLIFPFLASCKNGSGYLFTQVPPSHSHVNFHNNIKENENYNVLTYEYLYNGGGVAVGDINNDGLPDIIFTGNMTDNKLYLNKGNFQFEDITEQAGIKGHPGWKTGVVMADVNGDGLLDIYVCYSGPGTDADRRNELYINKGVKNGIPRFTECAKQYGLDAPGTYTTNVYFFDMDNDGDLDMFMVNHGDMFYNPYFNTEELRSTRDPRSGNRLYRNDNGHFVDISDAAHINGSPLNFGLSASISDVNNDGWPDIYVTNDYDERDFLYLNNHDGTFREVLNKAAGHISEFSMGSDIADYNNDGKPDIMVLDMFPASNHRQKLLRGPDEYERYNMRVSHGFGHQQMRNTLQLNNGNDTDGVPIFSEIGEFAGVSNTDWSWAPLFADFDNDGWKDLFITNGILRDITDLDFVKYTSGYTMDHSALVNPKEMWKVVRRMPSTKLSNYLFRNNHDLTFTNVSEAWGLAKLSVNNGAAYADLDNDGDLDLIINNLNDAATIYRNNTSEKTHAHYIRIRLKGEKKNTYGIGAKVYVKTDHTDQMQEEYTARGFQSSVDPVMHVGLGKDSIIRSIEVKWPGGKVSMLKNIIADRLLVINEDTASAVTVKDTIQYSSAVKPLFEDITQSSGINYFNHPSSFVDFKVFPLLPYQVSKIGPCIAKADVNGDGLEDLFIGSATGGCILYLQTKDGKFKPAPDQPWNSEKDIPVADAVFFDADGDGDMDLYLLSGGTDYPLNSKNYQDRIYENDGHGNFKKVPDALPAENISGGCVRAADINHDGLPDLFIGGRFKPGFFPEAPESFILINRSTKGNIRFEKDTTQTDPALLHPGMVTDALWLDINKDGWKDLVVVGQFMPVRIFINYHGKLIDKTKAYGLSETQGWWNRILADDFDKDGDTDLVIGNLGTNTQFKASVAEPLTITYADFDHDGLIDPILCYYSQGKSYPYPSRDELFEQIPSLHKKFNSYADYADAQLKDIFTREQLAKAHTIQINTFQSIFLHNDGGRKFKIEPLPGYSQISAVNGMVSYDVNGDGNKDIILAGNFFPMRAQIGPLDAGIGLILSGNGKGGFSPMPYSETGLYLPGDIRDLISLKGSKNYFLVAAKNDGQLQILKLIH